MAATKLVNLLAIASLAILACSFGPEPVNALSTRHGHLARDGARGHDSIAKRKRSVHGKRCKARSAPVASSTSESSSASTPDAATTTDAATTSFSPTPAPAPSSTSSSAVPTSTSSGGSSGGGKAGLAWPNGDDPSLQFYKTDKTNYLYTWSPEIPSSAWSLGFTPVPQLWGWNQATDFANTVKAGYATIALGPNEPDQTGQSNMSPASAAQLWRQYMEPLKSLGYRLGSPAVTSAPAGKVWMQEFFSECSDCSVDFVALHWYDISADAFIAYIDDFHTTFGKNIWVTEFAYQDFNGNAQGSLSQIQSFMGTVTSYMESQSWVEAYFWFGAMHDMQNVNPLNTLMTSSGSPSDLGYQFLNS